ncbi:hypothetical protein LY76DRAFT_591905 [Colletotrichum caudatum]|nr:hypothetical protein LY76DRAFT_591905 [Colletotrichum caudatum]
MSYLDPYTYTLLPSRKNRIQPSYVYNPTVSYFVGHRPNMLHTTCTIIESLALTPNVNLLIVTNISRSAVESHLQRPVNKRAELRHHPILGRSDLHEQLNIICHPPVIVTLLTIPPEREKRRIPEVLKAPSRGRGPPKQLPGIMATLPSAYLIRLFI